MRAMFAALCAWENSSKRRRPIAEISARTILSLDLDQRRGILCDQHLFARFPCACARGRRSTSAHEAAADDALQALARMVCRIDEAGDRVTHTLMGVAVQVAIDNSANQAPEDKLIAGYGQAYREWLIHGAQVGYARPRGANVKSRAGG